MAERALAEYNRIWSADFPSLILKKEVPHSFIQIHHVLGSRRQIPTGSNER